MLEFLNEKGGLEMLKRTFQTDKGVIHYWVSTVSEENTWLVFLPGLSADHRLFEKQIAEFKGDYNLLVWDPPGHNLSRPFELSFSLEDKGDWLHGILEQEGINKPVVIGQSMGGYVAQAFLEKYPHCLQAFISIDSAPLQRKYMKYWELQALKHTKLMYMAFPWSLLKKTGAKGCAETEYGYKLMYTMMETYTKKEYCELVSHGFRILAEAIEADLAYEITCPALLICGEQDKAGYTKRYNKAWAQQSGLPIRWISGAGHNANTDKPDEVNRIIREFLNR